MLRPNSVGNFDDAVQVIRQDHESKQIDTGKMRRYRRPGFACDLSKD